MPRDGRSYRKRSRSRSPKYSPIRSRRDKSRRSRSRDRSRRTSRERRRSKERRRRSVERKRSWDRDRRRSRSRSAGRTKKSRSRSRSPKHKEGAILVKDEPLDKEAEQKRLEDEMQKRRERIEQWRSERKKEDLPLVLLPPSKIWSLEDDEDEEDVKKADIPSEEDVDVKKADALSEEDVDPLDAYMQVVSDEVTKVEQSEQIKMESNVSNGADVDKTEGTTGVPEVKKGKVTFMMAVAKKRAEPTKGELMEANMDAMEYSSEEEEEGLDDTLSRFNNRKRELKIADHTKIYYRPFRKTFYVEVPEIANMDDVEVTALRGELEDITIRGKGCPKPIKAWAHCGVSKKIMECLRKNGFDKPTPIQAQAIPAIMSGKDLIGIAKTGSGKTLAFLLPMFRHILDQPDLEEDDGPVAVIMTPTRELAMQIGRESKKFTKALGLVTTIVYGGTGISEQIADLKRGCEVIVCTPGRMIDMLAANSGRVTNLRRCTYVVLDEADRMFDMGFEPQVMRIMDNIRPDRQTVMFSATFPRQMEALARKILQKPVEVQVGGRSVVCKDVEQYVVVLEEDKKFFKLLELLGNYQEKGSVLVFVDKQENADELVKMLMGHGYPCMPLHGGIDQYDRDSTITDFKQANVKLMIATSVAARGLDVKDLILVINFDCPSHYEDYVHRCGRTGRAGNHGFAYTFLTPHQGRSSGDIIRAFERSDTPIPEELQELWDGYVKEAEADGRKVHKSSGGFSGRGFKFDETEAQLAADRKKLQKKALGLQDSDDDDAGLDIDQQIENLFASRKRVTDVAKPMINQHIHPPSATNQEKLELAKRLAAKINMQRNLGDQAQDVTQQAALALWGGSAPAPQVSTKTIAEQMAEKINAKLGYRPPVEEEKPEEVPVETFKRYEEELEINDFPQTARWKVTSKEALSLISEYSEAGITVRGTYFPPKKEPKGEDERKLYLAIEATNELSIQKAKKEITRLIREELVRLQNSYQPGNRGRYKVM